MEQEEKKVIVDVEAIMQEVRANAAIQADLAGMPAFEDLPLPAGEEPVEQPDHFMFASYEESVDYLISNHDNAYYWTFGGNRIKVFFKRLVRKLCKCIMLPLVDRQNVINAHITHCLSQLKCFAQEITARVDTLEKQADIRAKRMDAINARMDALQAQINAANARIDQLFGISAQKDREFEKESDTLRAAAAKTMLAIEQMKAQLGTGAPVAEASAVAVPAQAAAAAAPAAEAPQDNNAYTVVDYFKFQNDFRGTRAQIRERQKIYLPYFRQAKAPVLDIGCGRGEFLGLLKENGIPAFGVDLYKEYVAEGQIDGLDVRQGDGVAFLKASDEQYGGIFSAQVIEHISFVQLQELCAAAYEKLLPDACLILETPNPTCLSTFTSSFYMDPTHNKPVHPLLLQYLLREIGFSKVDILYTEASRVDFQLPPLKAEGIENLEEVNKAIARVSDLLYGSLDYAVIARK